MALKELHPVNNHRVNLEADPALLEPGLEMTVTLIAALGEATQRSHAQIPDLQNLLENI